MKADFLEKEKREKRSGNIRRETTPPQSQLSSDMPPDPLEIPERNSPVSKKN